MADPRMPDLTIDSLRGGMNDEDPPHAIADDQAVRARNVEFWNATVGERRLGTVNVDLTSASLTDRTGIVYLGSHLPASAALSASELWAMGATIGGAVDVARRVAGTWSTVAPVDAFLNTSPAVFNIRSLSYRGKNFFFGRTAVDRMHVWDGTSLRRAGLQRTITAPTAADSGAPGGLSTTMIGVRTYRVRFTRQVTGTTVLRSEPSNELAFTPVGTDDGVIVTRPTAPGETETHWELEAKTATGNWYRIATTVLATTTYTDHTYVIGDYANGTLSEDIGDYTLMQSAKYGIIDQDRLVLYNMVEDVTRGSMLTWTVAAGVTTGVGNDERIPDDTDNRLDLGSRDGGDGTGLSSAIQGSFYAFKWSEIIKVQRRSEVTRAYEAISLGKGKGAIDGSVVMGVDARGNPAAYFLDPSTGPACISSSGVQTIRGLATTWKSVNTAAAKVAAQGHYYPDKKQIKWWVATGVSDTPLMMIVVQTDQLRNDKGGALIGGLSIMDGLLAKAICSCTLPESITDPDTGATRLVYRPYVGYMDGSNYVHRIDTGNDDNDVAYTSEITTKPYILRSLLARVGVMSAAILAPADDTVGASVKMTVIRNFGRDTTPWEKTILLAPEDQEEYVIKVEDSMSVSSITAIQVKFEDGEPEVIGSDIFTWKVLRFDLSIIPQDRN